MTNKEAIAILECLQEPEAWEPKISEDAYTALQMAIDALAPDTNVGSKGDMIYRQDAIEAVKHAWAKGLEPSQYIEILPSAQPEPGDDCVSRKAVIRLLHSGYHSRSMIEEVKELPPAQPEIIWCRDCKHWRDSDGKYRRGIGAESKCPLNLQAVYDGEFYCGFAERRTDE